MHVTSFFIVFISNPLFFNKNFFEKLTIPQPVGLPASAQPTLKYYFLSFFFGIYKSVIVPSKASVAMATVSESVGCG